MARSPRDFTTGERDDADHGRLREAVGWSIEWDGDEDQDGCKQSLVCSLVWPAYQASAAKVERSEIFFSFNVSVGQHDSGSTRPRLRRW
jgi:hypothetical protein